MRQLSLAVLLAACGTAPATPTDGGLADAPGSGQCSGQADGADCGGGQICMGGACVPSECGDGVVGPGEQCDDANERAFDGCQNDCTFTCTESAMCDDGDPCNGAEVCAANNCTGGTSLIDGSGCAVSGIADGLCLRGRCVRRGCGNGATESGEQCDDGNSADGDGCDGDCTFTCSGDGECAGACATGTTSCDLALHVCVSTSCAPSDPCHAGRCASGSCQQSLVDRDGDGAASSALGSCGTDCDDANPELILRQSWFADCDGDGFAGSHSLEPVECGPPAILPPCPSGGGAWIETQPVGANLDCDDGNVAINSLATELIGNAVDENCDGTAVCSIDADGDGFTPGTTARCGSAGTRMGTLATGDCCDTGAQTFPGQSACFTGADPCGSFDYNCDGSSRSCITGSTTCTGNPEDGCTGGGGAFIGTVACGASGSIRTCETRCAPADPDCNSFICVPTTAPRANTCR